jgi:NADPH2 dehydrogenase
MPTSALFTPIQMAGRTFANRIVISPMCQYSAEDGRATDWHLIHLGMLSNSGAGLLVVEATAVEAAGRISLGDLGLYDAATEAALARVVAACRRYGTAKLGIQIAHAGRQGSAREPWRGGGLLQPEEGAWQTLAPLARALRGRLACAARFRRGGFRARAPGLRRHRGTGPTPRL